MIFKVLEDSKFGFYLTNFFSNQVFSQYLSKVSQSRNPIVKKSLMVGFSVLCGSLNLEESEQKTFDSFHSYFIRKLKDKSRLIVKDETKICSPCDGIVGSFGRINPDLTLFQFKGESYKLEDLLANNVSLSEKFTDGNYLTLRIKPNFYHRFHMIMDGVIKSVTLVPGKFWNINNATLKNIPSLFCKNERALIVCEKNDANFLIIPVGTVLVGSIQLNFIGRILNREIKDPEVLEISKPYQKGDELGFFCFGSTVIVLLDKNTSLSHSIVGNKFIKMGQEIATYS